MVIKFLILLLYLSWLKEHLQFMHHTDCKIKTVMHINRALHKVKTTRLKILPDVTVLPIAY